MHTTVQQLAKFALKHDEGAYSDQGSNYQAPTRLSWSSGSSYEMWDQMAYAVRDPASTLYKISLSMTLLRLGRASRWWVCIRPKYMIHTWATLRGSTVTMLSLLPWSRHPQHKSNWGRETRATKTTEILACRELHFGETYLVFGVEGWPGFHTVPWVQRSSKRPTSQTVAVLTVLRNLLNHVIWESVKFP